MRSIKELLQLMLQNQHYLFSGLCSFCFHLTRDNKITIEERALLLNYIQKNRPSKLSSLDAFKNRKNSFYWRVGCREPRIKWIKKHIKLNS